MKKQQTERGIHILISAPVTGNAGGKQKNTKTITAQAAVTALETYPTTDGNLNFLLGGRNCAGRRRTRRMKAGTAKETWATITLVPIKA